MMGMTFDATLKDLGRDCPQGVLAEFDEPPTMRVSVLNADLSTVTKAADLVLGLGEPLKEIVLVEFQSSAAAWKHADLLAYNSPLFDQYHVPVHTILVLLRPRAAHPNTEGQVSYSARPGRGRMLFEYEVVRLWERPAERMLAGELGLAPLAVLGELPQGMAVEDGLAAVVQKLVGRLIHETQPDQSIQLDVSAGGFRGLRRDRSPSPWARRVKRVTDVFVEFLLQRDEIGALVGNQRLQRAGQKLVAEPDATVAHA